MKIEETVAYKQGKKAARLGVKLEQSGLVNLNPESERYDQFIAGYDSENKTLIAYQVGENDVVAAYDKEGAIQVLCGLAAKQSHESGNGLGDSFDNTVTDLTDKLGEMVKDENGNDLVTLGDWLKMTDEPKYLYGWE